MNTPLVLTERQKQLLEDLRELLEFGYSQISKQPYKKAMRPRKTILFTMMAAMHNYAEGIYSLLREARTNSAEVVLRPMIETFLNLAYIYVGRNEKNAVIFLLDDEYDRKKLGEKIKKFLSDYPTLKTSLDRMTTPKEWGDFVKERDKQIVKIKKRYKYILSQLPDLRQRAVIFDKSQETKHRKPLKSRLEWWYISMYWYFSSLTHLGARGLDTFFSIDKNGQILINASGKPEDIERIAVATYSTYYQFLRVFAKQFKLFDLKLLDKYKDIMLKYGRKK